MSEGDRNSERGRRASVDRSSGEVHGAGSGAGGGDPREDYDNDPTAGGGEDPMAAAAAGDREGDAGVSKAADIHKRRHPLPQSGEARHDRIPETDEREKGEGEDCEAIVQPGPIAVDPDGRPYPPYK